MCGFQVRREAEEAERKKREAEEAEQKAKQEVEKKEREALKKAFKKERKVRHTVSNIRRAGSMKKAVKDNKRRDIAVIREQLKTAQYLLFPDAAYTLQGQQLFCIRRGGASADHDRRGAAM